MDTGENFKSFYLTGAVASVIVICLTILDLIFGLASGGDLSMIPNLAVDKFVQLNETKLQGLYNLDLLNLIISVIMIPVFLALYIALKNEAGSFALLALIVFSIGTTVFIVNNSALAMLDLSQKYASSSTEDQRIIFAAAGEALGAKGAHGSPGVFAGFILITLSELIISLFMLNGRIFSRATAYFGVAGTSLLFIYLILVTFIPSSKGIAMILAAPGGILSIIWMIMYTRKLLQLTK